MKITDLTPEADILRELGARLARMRKQQGLSQTDLAEEAGLGIATLRRIEAGQDSQLASWLKLMKCLDRIAAVDSLLPEEIRSPRAEVHEARRPRRKSAASSVIVWGDETT